MNKHILKGLGIVWCFVLFVGTLGGIACATEKGSLIVLGILLFIFINIMGIILGLDLKDHEI